MAKGNSSIRTRNWVVIVYPESAPSSWREVLDDLHIDWVESPLHDKDVNADGELKKPHWHVLLMFPSLKTLEQIKALVEPLNCATPQVCQSVKGNVRYMIHMDNPEKHQYDLSSIVAHGAIDVMDLLRPSSAERYKYIAEMQEWVLANEIVEYQDLCDYARLKRSQDWFPLLCDSCTIVMNNYIKSMRHREQVKPLSSPPKQNTEN